MILHPFTQVPIVSLRRFADDAEYFEGVLQAEGVALPVGSPLADAIDVAKRIGRREQMPSIPSQIGKAAGVSYLVRLIAEAARRGQLRNVRRHLKYLADARANPLPTTKAKALQPRNMVFELEVACLAACCGLPVVLGDEPDVHIAASPSWDIACKAVSSGNSVTVGDRVEKAIEQVLRFDGDYGIGALGLANRIEHEDLMPLLSATEDIWGSFPSFESAAAALQDEFNAVLRDIQEQATTRFTTGQADQKFRGLLLIGHAACGINGVPALLSSIALVQRSDLYGTPLLEGPEMPLAERLNTAAHTMFWG